ncbi:hypothetical protein LBBP_03724 [Leptospira borgpetersenii serovar Ballum]|uniref:Uncharacterized protein n=1 Tax=Leptospira borgpetersenii serovar Ballum TaxID=280505 RepID=A0A0S2IW87_LEPBO|nr:hypothetical protein LBBP_03724 [Leptospira borgpetersenii serovar Ballum]
MHLTHGFQAQKGAILSKKIFFRVGEFLHFKNRFLIFFTEKLGINKNLSGSDLYYFIKSYGI